MVVSDVQPSEMENEVENARTEISGVISEDEKT